MIKVIFVENNEIKMSKEEFEKLLEETYKRGKDENYEAAYNKGYKDGYCNNHWGGYLTSTNSNPLNEPPYITYCNSTTTAVDAASVTLNSDLTSTEGCYAKAPLHPENYLE